MPSSRTQVLCGALRRREACVEVPGDEFQRAARAHQTKSSSPARKDDRPIELNKRVEKLLPNRNADPRGLRRSAAHQARQLDGGSANGSDSSVPCVSVTVTASCWETSRQR